MSQTTASGAGGSATPGWYTDPNDASQLRWWSGESWTEHVSGGAAAPEVAAAEPVAAPAQPVAEQPVAPQQFAEQPVAPQQFAEQPVAPQQFATDPAAQQAAVPSTSDPLPSRRALRDAAPETSASEPSASEVPASEATGASAAAEAALAGQQAQAEQAAAQAQQQAAYAQQAAQPQVAPVAPSQPSAPAPTLPVQPQSFLEQAGYTPLDGPAQPQAGQPPAAQPPAAQPPADWTPTAPGEPVAPVQPPAPALVAPQQPAQIPHAPQQVQPLDANAWDQAAAAAGPYSTLTPTQNQWNQPVAPNDPVAPVEQAWGAPGTAAPATAPTGMDALIGGAPAAAPATADPAAAGWGLSPTAGQPAAAAQEPDYGSRRRGSESAAPATAGSSTLWGWLIAISPILAAGAIGYVLASTGYVFSGWPIQAAIAAPYLLVLLFALADRSGLLALGHSSPRSPAWALLSAPVYLIVRASETRREDGTGTGLTLVWFVSFLVGLGGFVGYGFLFHHALIAGLPT